MDKCKYCNGKLSSWYMNSEVCDNCKKIISQINRKGFKKHRKEAIDKVLKLIDKQELIEVRQDLELEGVEYHLIDKTPLRNEVEKLKDGS